MTANYSNNASGVMRLIASSFSTIGTAAEDLATWFDMTPYESILVVVTNTDASATATTIKFSSSAASTGSSPVVAKDAAGADLIATIGTGAAGTSIVMNVRTRGMLKFGSPVITTAGAGGAMVVTVFGIAPRDTAGLAAGWTQTTTATNSAFVAGVAVTNTAIN